MEDCNSYQELQRYICSQNDNTIFVIKFWAEWCDACVNVGKYIFLMSEDPKYDNFEFVNINVNEPNYDTASNYCVEKLPMVIILKKFNDDEIIELDRYQGTEEENILNMLNKYIEN